MGLFTLERDVKKSFQGLVIIYVEEGGEKGDLGYFRLGREGAKLYDKEV